MLLDICDHTWVLQLIYKMASTIFQSVCVCLHVCTLQRDMCSICSSQKAIWCVFANSSLPYFFDTESLLEPGAQDLTRLVDQQTPSTCLTPPPQCWNYKGGTVPSFGILNFDWLMRDLATCLTINQAFEWDQCSIWLYFRAHGVSKQKTNTPVHFRSPLESVISGVLASLCGHGRSRALSPSGACCL